MENINTYKQLKKYESKYSNVRNILKSIFIKNSNSEKFFHQSEYIIFPFWHHVFDDEIESFISQIKFMKNYGDFISYDDAINLLKMGLKTNDKYFCLSFDDGFKNIYENVTDILLKFNAPCVFFIPTSFIDNRRDDSGQVFFNNNKLKINFLNWKDCKQISTNQIFEFGSHSVNHKIFTKLSHDECYFEIEESKKIIETNLDIKCKHFAPPVGIFSQERDLDLVKKLKYKSLSTTVRGKMENKFSDEYLIKRHHLLAGWEISYLKYFFKK